MTFDIEKMDLLMRPSGVEMYLEGLKEGLEIALGETKRLMELGRISVLEGFEGLDLRVASELFE